MAAAIEVQVSLARKLMAAPIGLGNGGEKGWLFAVTQEQRAAPFNQSTDSRQNCSKIRNKTHRHRPRDWTRTGNLTLNLVEAAQSVFVVELDKRMVEVLQKRVEESGVQDRLTVINKDALKAEFPPFDLVVANIPYGISSPLVAKLVYGARLFRSTTLLLQREFARRLLAKPGDSEFNRLAVNVNLVADVEFVMDVSKKEFVPCPEVDSSIVIIRPKAEVPNVNLDEWWAFIKACFCKKNRTLGATFKQKKKVMELLGMFNLAGSNGESKDYISSSDNDDDEGKSDEEEFSPSSCSEIGASSFKEKLIGVLKSGNFVDKRPSKLSNEELLHLLAMFNQKGIYFHDHS